MKYGGLRARGKADQTQAAIEEDFESHLESFRRFNDGKTLNSDDVQKIGRLAAFALCYIVSTKALEERKK